MLNEGNQIHIFKSSFGSGTAINYGSVSTSKKVTVPTVPCSGSTTLLATAARLALHVMTVYSKVS
jgi:hypothetical protein